MYFNIPLFQEAGVPTSRRGELDYNVTVHKNIKQSLTVKDVKPTETSAENIHISLTYITIILDLLCDGGVCAVHQP